MKEENRERTRHKYVYESERVDDKVVKHYVGRSGRADVELAHSYERIVTAENKRLKAERQRERDECQAVQSRLDSFFAGADFLDWLHEHFDELQLPKSLASRLDSCGNTTDNGAAHGAKVTHSNTVDTRTMLKKLLRDVERGDSTATQQFQQILDANPQVLQTMTDYIDIIKNQIVRLIAGESKALRQTIEMTIQNDIVQILGSNQSCSIERMDAELILLLRIDYFRCHMMASRVPESRQDAKFWESMKIRAGRRYGRALEAFEKRRRARQRH